MPLDKFPGSPQVYKSSFAGSLELLHQHVSAGGPSARRLSADFIDDGQTLSNNATREKLGNERANIFMANGVFK